MNRVKVTADVLREKWFSIGSVAMTDDHQTRTRVVRMSDGSEFETPFDELNQQVAGGDSE